MPKFFIHARRGEEIVRDLEGQELPDLDAAQEAALQSVRELVEEIKHETRHPLEGMIISDESGEELKTIRATDILER